MEKIGFKRFSEFIHGYYLEGLHDKLLSYKNIIDIKFQEKVEEMSAKSVANVVIDDEEFYREFYPIFSQIVIKYYLVDNEWVWRNFAVYKQSNEYSVNDLHNHISTSTITAVTYLNPPKSFSNNGGELEIFIPPNNNKFIEVEKDWIYFFPSWALHRPLPQRVNEPRYSINWGYNCSKRPIHKLTGDRW